MGPHGRGVSENVTGPIVGRRLCDEITATDHRDAARATTLTKTFIGCNPQDGAAIHRARSDRRRRRSVRVQELREGDDVCVR